MALVRTVGIRLLVASLESHATLFSTAVLYPVMLLCYRLDLNLCRR